MLTPSHVLLGLMAQAQVSRVKQLALLAQQVSIATAQARLLQLVSALMALLALQAQ